MAHIGLVAFEDWVALVSGLAFLGLGIIQYDGENDPNVSMERFGEAWRRDMDVILAVNLRDPSTRALSFVYSPIRDSGNDNESMISHANSRSSSPMSVVSVDSYIRDNWWGSDSEIDLSPTDYNDI